MLKFTDRLYDTVFGYIDLTEIEVKIINTPIFQRLHHIKQLGMAHIIFPNAVHTRFAHSLGVMFIMDKMVNHIRRNLSAVLPIEDEEHQLLRLAALLHDVGHFPFSHLGEKATENVAYRRATADEVEEVNTEEDREKGVDLLQAVKASGAKLHERLSCRIVQKWEDLRKVLTSYNIVPDDVGRIIVGGSLKLHHTMLLHSELDADRLDYLLRDSTFLGVSYGNIELDHIVSMLDCKIYEDEPILGVKEKGIHAVEHYVLARYFMYIQIIFNPKIYYLERLLNLVYEYMIECMESSIHIYDKTEINTIINENDHHRLYDFNDNYLMYRMRLLHNYLDSKLDRANPDWNSLDFIVNESIKLILSGQIPQAIIAKQAIIDLDSAKKIESYKKVLKVQVESACKQIGYPIQAVFYDFPPSKLTKMRSLYDPEKPPSPDEREEATRVIYSNRIGFIVSDKSTLLNQVNTKQLQFFYLFVNPIILDKLGIDIDTAKKAFQDNIDTDILF